MDILYQSKTKGPYSKSLPSRFSRRLDLSIAIPHPFNSWITAAFYYIYVSTAHCLGRMHLDAFYQDFVQQIKWWTLTFSFETSKKVFQTMCLTKLAHTVLIMNGLLVRQEFYFLIVHILYQISNL